MVITAVSKTAFLSSNLSVPANYSPRSFSENERRLKIKPPSENPPIGNTKRKKIIKNPIELRERYIFASFSGKIKAKIFEPSSGGIGTKLKNAKRRFTYTIVPNIKPTKLLFLIIFKGKLGNKKRQIKAKMSAINTFVKGPANETIAMSFRPSLRLNGSTGTGFAAPKITGEPERIKIRGRAILIKGSMCFLGLRVSLPDNLAVGSPRRSATKP